MLTRISFLKGVFSAGAVAGALSAALVLGAAGIGWLVGSAVLAGTLAMIVSSILLIGFGGMSAWAMVIVGLSWAFADWVLGALGISGTAAHVTMGIAYLILGMTEGKMPEEVLYAGAGPVLGSVVGIGLAAVVFPQHVAQQVEEAVLSAAMIAAARTAIRFAAILRSQSRPEA